VALVVFVRKHQPEIQYLKTSISEEQRLEFGRLLAATIGQFESAQFPFTAAYVSRKMAASTVLMSGYASRITN
ncbi:MAG: hypothetical protein WB556_12940, partial [Candidatus Acidiferrum sp.]